MINKVPNEVTINDFNFNMDEIDEGLWDYLK